MTFSEPLAVSLEQQGWLYETLSELDAPRAYVFGVLLYEEVVAMLEVWQTAPPGVEEVVATLWNRYSSRRRDPLLDSATDGWIEEGSTPRRGMGALARMPERFNWASFVLTDSAVAEAMQMWDHMTGIVPDEHYPRQFAAERALVAALQADDFDLMALRATAQEVGRQLALLEA